MAQELVYNDGHTSTDEQRHSVTVECEIERTGTIQVRPTFTFEQLLWLREELINEFPFIPIPPLLLDNTISQQFFISRVLHNDAFRYSKSLHLFNQPGTSQFLRHTFQTIHKTASLFMKVRMALVESEASVGEVDVYFEDADAIVNGIKSNLQASLNSMNITRISRDHLHCSLMAVFASQLDQSGVGIPQEHSKHLIESENTLCSLQLRHLLEYYLGEIDEFLELLKRRKSTMAEYEQACKATHRFSCDLAKLPPNGSIKKRIGVIADFNEAKLIEDKKRAEFRKLSAVFQVELEKFDRWKEEQFIGVLKEHARQQTNHEKILRTHILDAINCINNA